MTEIYRSLDTAPQIVTCSAYQVKVIAAFQDECNVTAYELGPNFKNKKVINRHTSDTTKTRASRVLERLVAEICLLIGRDPDGERKMNGGSIV